MQICPVELVLGCSKQRALEAVHCECRERSREFHSGEERWRIDRPNFHRLVKRGGVYSGMGKGAESNVDIGNREGVVGEGSVGHGELALCILVDQPRHEPDIEGSVVGDTHEDTRARVEAELVDPPVVRVETGQQEAGACLPQEHPSVLGAAGAEGAAGRHAPRRQLLREDNLAVELLLRAS